MTEATIKFTDERKVSVSYDPKSGLVTVDAGFIAFRVNYQKKEVLSTTNRDSFPVFPDQQPG